MMRLQKLYLFPIAISCALQQLACRDEPTAPESTATALQIVADSFETFSGGTLQMTAMATLKGDAMRDVTAEAVWSISPGIAGQIDENGLFRATIRQRGVETVRAEFQGLNASATIEVTKRAQTLSIIPTLITVTPGQSVQFTALGDFEDNTREVITSQVSWQLVRTINPDYDLDRVSIDSTGLFMSLPTAANGQIGVICSYQDLTEEAGVIIDNNANNLFDLVQIPGGTFTMGDNNSATRDQQPEHQVSLDPFLISRFEITNAEYVAYLNNALRFGELTVESGIVTATRGPFRGLPYMALVGSDAFPDQTITFDPEELFQVRRDRADHPAVRLTWYGALAFCDFYGLRLPTEAEWEYLSRGGRQLDYGTSDGSISHDLANYAGVGGADMFSGPAPVGSFQANPFGLHDLSGNAAEYVFDMYDPDYYRRSLSDNPFGPGPERPLGRLRPLNSSLTCRGGAPLVTARGGSWVDGEIPCRSAFRTAICDLPDIALTFMVGFRVAKSME